MAIDECFEWFMVHRSTWFLLLTRWEIADSYFGWVWPPSALQRVQDISGEQEFSFLEAFLMKTKWLQVIAVQETQHRRVGTLVANWADLVGLNLVLTSGFSSTLLARKFATRTYPLPPSYLLCCDFGGSRINESLILSCIAQSGEGYKRIAFGYFGGGIFALWPSVVFSLISSSADGGLKKSLFAVCYRTGNWLDHPRWWA